MKIVPCFMGYVGLIDFIGVHFFKGCWVYVFPNVVLLICCPFGSQGWSYKEDHLLCVNMSHFYGVFWTYRIIGALFFTGGAWL